MKLLSALLLCGSFACAAVDDEPSILAGTMIEVHHWDARSRTYDIIMTDYSAQGPNYATIESLSRAVASLKAERLKNKPEAVVGMSYKLDADLKLESVLKTERARKVK